MMKDDISDIAAYYDRNPDMEHRRLEEHQLEYDLTLRFLYEYLPDQGSILEVGAATGRYTLALAERGYSITAVDLSAELIKNNQQIISESGLGEFVEYRVADARDLSNITMRDYDGVLLMGPLYHLIDEGDRKRSLTQAHQHLKTGGVIFSAFISRYGIMGDLMKNFSDWIENQKEVETVLSLGRDPDDYPKGGFRAYFAEVSEIKSLHEALGFETMALVGVEPAISADDESYNKLEGTQRQLWLDLLYKMSREESLIGASRHLLYIGRKTT